MTRREHPIDAHVRRLPLLSDEQAAAMSTSAAKQALFERIAAMPVTTDAPPAGPHTRSPRRLPRRTLVLATILATLSFAAVGSAAVTWLAQATTVACHTDASSVTVVKSVTGDPVVDCQAAWRDMGMEPPGLAAYDNGRGGIEVIPATDPPQPGWQALDAGVVQDPRLLELDAALADVGSGLPSGCHLLPEARTIAAGHLERLELTSWTTSAERGEADGTSTCTYYYLDPAQQQVVLIPLEGIDASDSPFPAYARDLAAALADDCHANPEAAMTARDLASDAGIADMGLVVQEVTDDTTNCARATVTVGGRVEVVIRGPAAP